MVMCAHGTVPPPLEKSLKVHVTHSLSSASSSFMAEKLALPTPTMMIDMGSADALMIANLVSTMSLNTPSVNSSRTKYCYM